MKKIEPYSYDSDFQSLNRLQRWNGFDPVTGKRRKVHMITMGIIENTKVIKRYPRKLKKKLKQEGRYYPPNTRYVFSHGSFEQMVGRTKRQKDYEFDVKIKGIVAARAAANYSE